jgi:hypothetical protein
MDKKTKEFWEKWYYSDEIRRLKLLKNLTICDGKTPVSPSVLNSYLEELIECVDNIYESKIGDIYAEMSESNWAR